MPRASQEMIIKAIRLVHLLMRKKQVIVPDVADELEISRRDAHNWLLAASIVLPIYSPNEETRKQTEYIVYELIDEDLEFSLIEGLLTKRMQMGMAYFERRRARERKSQNNESWTRRTR